MAVREQAPRVFALTGLCLALGCSDPAPTIEPSERPRARPVPVLSDADEALLASLLADDPGDFHVARARIWRVGPARWNADGPEFVGRPEGLRGGALDQPIEVVVVDSNGPRVLLPLGEAGRVAQASSLRLVATLEAGDLVAGLTRELRPTPWLTLAAGVGLTPREREDDHLRVRWSDSACGFGLELMIDAADFGPLYEPGPAGRPSDEPDGDPVRLRVAPGTPIFADADAREPIIRLDPDSPSEAERLSAAQRVRLIGEPVRKLQQIELRCRGVTIAGYVPSTSLVELPGRFAVVDPSPPPSSTCAGFGAEPVLVPRATPLFEPSSSALVGVVADDVELGAVAAADGWWRACVPSPWGDLYLDFRPR